MIARPDSDFVKYINTVLTMDAGTKLTAIYSSSLLCVRLKQLLLSTEGRYEAG